MDERDEMDKVRDRDGVDTRSRFVAKKERPNLR